jgi:hypothetical protein
MLLAAVMTSAAVLDDPLRGCSGRQADVWVQDATRLQCMSHGQWPRAGSTFICRTLTLSTPLSLTEAATARLSSMPLVRLAHIYLYILMSDSSMAHSVAALVLATPHPDHAVPMPWPGLVARSIAAAGRHNVRHHSSAPSELNASCY